MILALLCSILPTYSGATDNPEDSQAVQKEKEPITTDNLEEVVKERTASSKTFTDGDGNFVKEIYQEEVHNKVDGKYQTISEDLVEKGNNGYVETETTNLQSMFPEKLGEDKPLVYQSGEHKLSFELNSASDGEKQTKPNYSSELEKKENSITYKSLYPQIDLRHVALNNEVKEDWIMNEYNGINEFHYTIQTDLYGQVEKDGSIGFYENESKEKTVFTLPKPVMVDSNYNETLGDGIRSTDIHYKLNKKSDNSYELVLNASKEWLSSPKRVFPIYIDPSVSIDALGDTFVMSAYPNNNYNKEWDPSQGEYVLKTGYYDSTTGTNYPFIKFSVIGDLKGATIDSAQLAAYVTHSYYADTKTGIWVDEVKGPWYVDELTWNNKPSSTNITSTTAARDEWAYFDVKNTVQAWVNGTRENYGFKFHTNGNGKTYWKKITAAESKKAKLVIGYHYNKMTNPTVNSYSYGEGKADGYIDVKWNAVYGAQSYDLQLFDGKGYQTIYSGTTTSWSTKGKKIFPKSPYTTSSSYKTDGTGVELLVDPSDFYSAKSGTATTKKDYGFRVVAKFASGDSPVSTAIYKTIPVLQVGSPELPTVTANAYPETDTVNKGRGWLNISWKPVTNATGYKVLIWNGEKYEEFSVGNVTSVSTKGKKIWPTDAEIAAGKNELHITDLRSTGTPSTGVELPIDPGPTYKSSSKRYSIRVKAVTSLGDSPSSDVNYGYIPLLSPKNVKVTGNVLDYVQNKGKLDVQWDAVEGAGSYQVEINTGESYKEFTVKGDTHFDTTSKTLFDKITDLPVDPTNYYSSGTPQSLKDKKAYQVRVKAYRFDDEDDNVPVTETEKMTGPRGLSAPSSSVYGSIPFKEDLIGLEDYFTYDESLFGNASSSVNVTTGNMVLQFTDESLYTRSNLGYDFTRTYNSRSTKASVLGTGWTFIGNESLTEVSNGDVLYEDEDGTVHTFKKDGDAFISPKGLYENLKKDNNMYTMTDKNNFVQTFKVSSTSGKYVISSYADDYKNHIDFKRNEKGQIIEVSETKGTSNQKNILISYTSDKISKVQYGDHWTTYKYTGDQLTQTTTGSDQSDQTITENFAYDSTGQLVIYTDSKNNVTTFKYNENELVVFDKQADGEELSVTNTYKFNQKENEYVVTDSSDNETVYKRDEKNDTFAVVQEDEPGDDEQNTQTFYTHDAQYNVVDVTNPDGTTGKNTYDAKGNLLTSITKDGTTTNTYNDQNQLVKSVATNGEETTNIYDGPSLITSKVKDEETKYTYDIYGRAIKTTYANNTFDEINYDDDARKVTSTDKKGNQTSVTYSIYGQKLEEVDADGHKKVYTYDPIYVDTMTSVTDGNGHITAYQFDDNKNLTSLTDALNRQKTYTYNDNDQVTNVTMPNMEFRYSYDQDGEMSQSVLPSGITTNYTYNSDGQLDQLENGNETITFQYDENGNTSTVLRDGKLLKKFGYTVETNLLSNYTFGLFTQTYGYDDQERETNHTTTYDTGLSISQKTNYKENSDDIDHIKYDVDNETIHDYQSDIKIVDNQTTLTLNDGLLKQETQRNDANLLSTLTYTSKVQQPFKITYDYTKNGNIAKEAVNGQESTFEYDQNNQLKKENLPVGTVNTYEYDAVGNRTKSNVNGNEFTFTYNDANQITKKNDATYKYDADGNLVQDENYQYTYNEQQRLTKVQTLDGKDVASYTYDENGLRLSKTVGDTTHEYFYNDEVLDMEVVKVNNEITQYCSYEWNGYTPLGMIVKAKNDTGEFETKAYQFITNQRGDVLSIRDNEDKEVGSYKYDAYGNVLTTEGVIAKENPIRYAGYYYDEETKNYYLQARYYNPENGSFLALDPHPGDDDEPLSQNGYTYANNNPVMYTDPDGEIAKYIAQALLFLAKPLIKKYGGAALTKARKYMIQKASKYLKKWGSKYKVQSNGGALLKVIEKGKGRVFSLDYHTLPKVAYLKKWGKKTSKQYGKGIWHYHYKSDVHYIIAEFIPSKVYIKTSANYKVVW